MGADVASELAADLPVPQADLHAALAAITLPALGEAWPAWLAAEATGKRTRLGSWYTPPALCAALASAALAARSSGDPASVLDPACGDGRFLWAALDAQVALGLAPAAVLPRLCGIDRDPGAVWLTRAGLWQRYQAAGGASAAQVRAQVRWGDALPGAAPDGTPAVHPPTWLAESGAQHGADVVLGNPPYLSQLRDRTARDRAAAAALASATDGEVVGYSDTAVAFWALASRWLAPGGVLCLLLPRSVLAARDAAPVRRGLAQRLTLQWAWRDDRLLFDASVRTAALVLADRPLPATLPVYTGLPPRLDARLPAALSADPDRWAAVLLDAADHALAVPPRLHAPDHPIFGQLAQITADFRDEYYGLAPGLAEGPADARLRVVTSGLVDPLGHAWGQRPCRLLGQLWTRPQLLPERLDAAQQRWWSRRSSPKVLVATQTAVLEAVADPEGRLVPVTPLLSVLPHDPGDVWPLAVALTAPVLSRLALERHAGAGLSAGALKLSARQLAALPLPIQSEPWREAVRLARALRPDQPAVEQALLDVLLVQLGLAYGQSEPEARAAADWWWHRMRRSPPHRG